MGYFVHSSIERAKKRKHKNKGETKPTYPRPTTQEKSKNKQGGGEQVKYRPYKWRVGNSRTSPYNGFMPTTHKYQVVTLKQAALILGSPWLQTALSEKFTAINVQVFTSTSDLPDSIDLDYIALSGEQTFPKELRTLISTHTPRAIFLSHQSQQVPDNLPQEVVSIKHSDCFGPDFTSALTLTSFLESAYLNKEISLPEDGLIDYHLMTDQDLAEGVFLALTTASKSKEVILESPSSISFLSLAYLIRSNLAHEVKLNFDSKSPGVGQGKTSVKAAETSKALNWKPTVDLAPSLTNFIKSYLPPKENTVEKSPPISSPEVPPVPPQSTPHLSKLSDLITSTKETSTGKTPAQKSPKSLEFVPIKLKKRGFSRPKFPRIPKLSSPKPLAIVTAGIVIAFLLYLLALVTSITLTALTINSLKDSVSSSSIPTKASLVSARVPAVFLEVNLVVLSSLPGLKSSSSLIQLSELSTHYRLGLDSLLLAHDLATTSADLLSYVLGAGEGDILSLINNARLLSSELYESLSLLDGALPSDPLPILPDKAGDTYLKLKASLQTLKASTLTAKALLATAPDLLGVGDRRKYLVLFQNNMELRPTGGFIGSFALMSFENGKLYDMPIFDVYSADGQLKGHVEPPKEIKEYLGEANWFMRDSNWDPDFPTSARRAQWFLDKTLDKQVNGTIAVNVYTLANLLDALGPVTIPDYDEEITAKNIFERAEYHSEVNFFPGSTQKKEFLSSVANALFQQLTELSAKQALPVAQAIARGIDEKNTLLSLDSEVTNHTFSTLGWNGELRTPSCPGLGGSCYSDYAMLVDANLGVNKANYFLNRSLQYAVTFDKDLSPSYLFTATYQNTSTSSSWPAGPYKSYSRMYLPSDVIFDSLRINGENVKLGDVNLSAEHSRLVVGYLLNVPVGSTAQVELRYHRASTLSSDSPTYSFYWQKQPGTAGDPLSIYLNYPLFLEPDIISPQANLAGQQLEFAISNITDRRITVKFQ